MSAVFYRLPVPVFLALNIGLLPLVVFPRWLASFADLYHLLVINVEISHGFWINPLIFILIFTNLRQTLHDAERREWRCIPWCLAAALWFQNGSENSLRALFDLYGGDELSQFIRSGSDLQRTLW